MKASIKILKQMDVLFEGTLVANEPLDAKHDYTRILLNIEEAINAEAGVRCHIFLEDEKPEK